MNEETTRALQTMRDSFARAATGPLLTTTLVPLTNQGNLRITYNSAYSVLHCDPNDSSSFSWTIINEGPLDGTTYYSLSPTDGYNGMTLYASVRDDYDWWVQTQAPYPVHSANWITTVQDNERFIMKPQGLNIVQFQSYSGQNIAVQEGEPGYRVQSPPEITGNPNPQAALWFMSVSKLLQPGLQVRLASEMTPDDIRACYASCGLTASDDDVARIMKAIG